MHMPYVCAVPWRGVPLQAVVLLVLSCSLAVAVNISQFMVLGRFSAVTFQV